MLVRSTKICRGSKSVCWVASLEWEGARHRNGKALHRESTHVTCSGSPSNPKYPTAEPSSLTRLQRCWTASTSLVIHHASLSRCIARAGVYTVHPTAFWSPVHTQHRAIEDVHDVEHLCLASHTVPPPLGPHAAQAWSRALYTGLYKVPSLTKDEVTGGHFVSSLRMAHWPHSEKCMMRFSRAVISDPES